MLFADVRGYTNLTEGLAPAEVPALLNHFYETASTALLEHEALLGQIEGDNVMALFVPGLASRTYARKAVEAALSLLLAVGPTSDFSIEIGIGVASGEEFVGNVGGGGFKDFAAVGDVTNTAARLTAQAQAGEVLVDAATYEAVASDYPHAERRQLTLKGKSVPVEAHAIAVDRRPSAP